MRRGFTLVEMLIGGSIMLVVVLGALTLYMRSNKISADQQQYAEVQQDVRTSMFFITRDSRMAGVGLPVEFAGFFLEGVDNDTTEGSGLVTPDRLKIMGNIDEPLVLKISNYQGSSVDLALDDYSFEKNPYPDSYYDNKIAIILPNPASSCRAAEIRSISHVTHNPGGTNEKLNFSPGQAPGINPPGGLSGTCPSPSDYDGGYAAWVDVKEYWLDVTGNFPGLTAGTDGYIGGGQGGVLYLTHNGTHYPIARNIENLQFQYNGDLDSDGHLDGFKDWDNTWSVDEIGRIIQVRILVLGRTPNASASVSGTPSSTLFVYRRPGMANTDPETTAEAKTDRHRRFLLESTSSVRNMSLNLYNNGLR